MSALISLNSHRIATALIRRSPLHTTPAAFFTSFQKFSKPKYKKIYNQTRSFFKKQIPRDAIAPILFGGGVLATALGIACYGRWQEFKYADSSYHPFYQRKPSHQIQKVQNIETVSKVKLPAHVRHVIIGAGAAGMAAARAIRGSDPLAKILMITGDESCGEPALSETGGLIPPPYIRPLLSKGLWWRKPERRQSMLSADGDIRKHSWLYFEPQSFFIDPAQLEQAEEGGISLLRNNPVTCLLPDNHQVTLLDGQTVTYDCCLIATGARPRRLPELERCSHSGVDLKNRVTYFRSLFDYQHLQSVSDRLHKTGGKIAIIGGGPLGSELSVSISGELKLAKDEESTSVSTEEFSVHHFITGPAPMANILPPSLAFKVADFERSKGVRLSAHSNVARISLAEPNRDPNKSRLSLSIHRRNTDGMLVEEAEEEVDHVVIVAGVEPRTELAATAGLELDTKNGGFLVNSEMKSRADVYVAGDAASFWDAELGYRRRTEHLNFAEETGTLAGLNMANTSKSTLPENALITPPEKVYDPSTVTYQPSFWCSLGKGAAYDAVGQIDSRRLITRSIFLEDAEKPSTSVVFYLTPKENRLVGILLWNLSEDFYTDMDYAAPSRLHVARHMLRDQLTVDIGEDEEKQLTALAKLFDLGGEIQESYMELKAFTDAKKKDTKDLTEEEFTKQSNKKVDEVLQSPETTIPLIDSSASNPTANLIINKIA